MKIKKKRQVRLDELMKYVWDNNITRTRFEGKDCSIYVDSDGDIDVDEVKHINKDSLFTITEEIEINRGTRLNLIAVREEGTVSRFENKSIQDVLAYFIIRLGVEVDYIYIQYEDGFIGDLIWSKEEVDWLIKIKWIKVGDIIEVDGKKAKLKSIGEDFRYATIYTFKREDGSKFYWWHREVYEYVMNRHIRKLENLLSDEKQRADELQDIIERFLYANRESDIYAICSEQELVNEYERIKIKFSF